MEEHATGTAARDGGSGSAGFLRRDLALLGLLLLAATGMRAWHLTRTEVLARDSIGYIRNAWQFQHHGFLATLRDPKREQQPGYPLTVVAVSHAVRPFVAGPETAVMQLSAQLASSLASVLLVIPTFYLGRALFHRGAGFWGSLFFQCLPASGRLFADGLSEGVFFLIAATALLGAVRAFRAHSPAWFVVTGLCGGLAYVVRPEGALIVAATGAVLVVVQCVRSRRAPWPRFLVCGLGLSAAALLTVGPLVAITGSLTAKHSENNLKEDLKGLFGDAIPPSLIAALGRGGADGSPEPLFAAWLGGPDTHPSAWACRALALEFAKAFHYVLWLPMLLGLWWFRDRFRLLPGAWVLLLVSLAILALMWRIAAIFGYVSDRHLLLPVLSGSYWAVAAAPKIASGLAALFGRLPLARLGQRLPAAASPAWPAVLLAALVASTLPKTLEPLHVNRSGFRSAGLWIAETARPWDDVLDPYGWSHFYAGKEFLDGQPPPPPDGEQKVCYVVLEEVGRQHSRLPEIRRATDLAARGHPVWSWEGRRGKERVEVIVYEAPPG
jgi:hypothetical protein